MIVLSCIMKGLSVPSESRLLREIYWKQKSNLVFLQETKEVQQTKIWRITRDNHFILYVEGGTYDNPNLECKQTIFDGN